MEVSASRINEINKLLLAYSAGKYLKKAKISSLCDDFDSILAGLNMLGEELSNTTVTRDFFSSIYNATTDMIFVVSQHGIIENVNQSAYSSLGYREDYLKGMAMHKLLDERYDSEFLPALKSSLRFSKTFSLETFLRAAGRKKIPVELSCSKIMNLKNIFKSYLIVANNITERKQAEQRILRTMYETQQIEQARISRDLHDSLGAMLSNIKLQFSSLLLEERDFQKREIVNGGLKKLDNVIQEIRATCSNIMPSSLAKFGLKIALQQFIEKWQRCETKIHLCCSDKIVSMEKPISIAVYFIILEFINNTVKYARAKNIFITLLAEKNRFVLDIYDDGSGFILQEKLHSGRGLSNMASRIKAFEGNHKIITRPGNGTRLLADFPRKFQAETGKKK